MAHFSMKNTCKHCKNVCTEGKVKYLADLIKKNADLSDHFTKAGLVGDFSR